ncbi:hypothetical protein ANO11243_044360 [Dothideomycetidae sp. 11243]|nr:hypothetical protein ANO11243_044360 [fungal sp. No.11243]
MVGPRSTGCRTCVGRKIKCDGTRPTCHRCSRAGYECLGYQRPLQWLNPSTNTGSFSQGSRRSSSDNRRAPSNAPSSSSSSNPSTGRTPASIGILSLSMPGLEQPPIIYKIPSAFDDNAYCLFFLNKYFSFGSCNDDLQSNKTWIWQALQSPSEAPVSNLAVRSLVTAFSANIHRNQGLRKHAFALQRSALVAMRQAVQSADISFDILSATCLLGMYETCLYTNREAWRNHNRAMQLLVQMKGPAFFQERPARSLLVLSRHSIIVEAVVSKRRCFLEDPKWSNILKSDSKYASMTFGLGDLFLRGPGAAEEVRLVASSRDSAAAAALFQKLLQILDELRAWWHLWSADPARLPIRMLARNEEGRMRPPPPMPGSTESTVSHFCTLDAAAAFCRYHAHVISMMRWINQLLDLRIPGTITHAADYDFISISDDSGHSRIPANTIESHAYAVCEALHFCALPSHNSIGAVYMTLPAVTAFYSLPASSPHAAWMKELMVYLGHTSGFEMPKYILRDSRREGSTRATTDTSRAAA